MKIRNSGWVWFFVIGVPVLALCVMGLLALLVRWNALARLCARWVEEIKKADGTAGGTPTAR